MDSFAAGPGRGRRRRWLLIPLFTIAMMGIAVGGASWLTNGLGFGRSEAGTMQNLTIVPNDVDDVGALFPNGTGGLAFDVTNPNGSAVTVQSIGAGAAPVFRDADLLTPGAGADAGTRCALSLNSATLSSAVNGTVIAANATRTYNVAAAVSMGSSASNTCQGQAFDVSLVLTASTA